jgi:hypothetical protein
VPQRLFNYVTLLFALILNTFLSGNESSVIIEFMVVVIVLSAVCDDCGQEWEGDCPIHGALTIVKDTKVTLH